MAQNPVFNKLMVIAGWQVQQSSHITITGKDPVLPTRFRVGEMAAGIHAACGAAIAKLWEHQTGRLQKVEVNVRAAAASLNSYVYMRRPTPNASPTTIQSERGQLSMMEFFRTKDDRWIFLHAGRDHFHDNALKLLRCQESTDSIAATISQWEAQPLEDALNAGGCMGIIARSIDEWNEHPQGKALRNLPVVEVIRIGDSPPEPLGRGNRPLSGVRVMDVTDVLSGPTCGRTLAEHGADVLRVDSPSDTRMKPLTFVIDTGHGKHSTFLDFHKDSDFKKTLSLIAQADVFSENYRFGKLAGLGLSDEALAIIRPGIIYTSLNCYGYDGPWCERPGMEQIAQTASGVALEEGKPDRPRILPGAFTDYTAGYLAAFGTLVALYRRACEGGSYHVRTSLTQSAMLLTQIARVAQTKEQVKDLAITPGEISRLSEKVETIYGTMSRLAPVVQLSETPARWLLPSVPLGTHPPEWW